MSKIGTYLRDPFLKGLYSEIRAAGAIRSISIDLTNECNLRCKGCYFFEEKMDATTSTEEDFDRLIESEKQRGTNFVTIVGGEPSLVIDRIKKIYDNFRCNVATNGLKRIPYEGLEDLPIGISLWGNQHTDSSLRANGRRDLFAEARKNYRDDSRAFWYYTVAPGYADEIESVVDKCIENGNAVLFNYYSDLMGLGGKLDYQNGFDEVRSEIDRMIEKYPGKILMTPYFNKVISTGQLLGETWGYDVCTNLSIDKDSNFHRFENGNPYNPHFKAVNSDFKTTRRCCTGVDRSCDSCFDTWEHFSWVMVNLKKHLDSEEHFTNWLATMYLFYYINRLVPKDEERLRRVQEYLQTNNHEESKVFVN
jgi:MoaA/NifB/PqqE/SkfB family radical SAM enzyme